jgi:N-acetylglucosamine-6-phosphate deacetylase
MADLIFHNARVLLGDTILHGGVLVRDGLIRQVFANDQTPAGMSAPEKIDLQGAYLASGFIDIHIHGSVGVDVQATDADGLLRLSQFLLSQGITSYFATFVPADDRAYDDAIAMVEAFRRSQKQEQGIARGSEIVGIHFEGPFVNEGRCGALQRRHFKTYNGDPDTLGQFVRSESSSSRLMTLAPEIDGGLELIQALVRGGVRVFIGHSKAEPTVLDHASAVGARHITHFPNALDPLHHRKPGAVGWGLVRPDVTVDCIADLHHVDPLMLRLIYQSKGPDRVALISDAIKPTGLGDGEFTVWGDQIKVSNGLTSLVGHVENTIAGSVITLTEAVRNFIGIGVSIHEAVRMASTVPANISGLTDRGRIQEGFRADLISFDDDLVMRMAAVAGIAVRLNSSTPT